MFNISRNRSTSPTVTFLEIKEMLNPFGVQENSFSLEEQSVTFIEASSVLDTISPLGSLVLSSDPQMSLQLDSGGEDSINSIAESIETAAPVVEEKNSFDGDSSLEFARIVSSAFSVLTYSASQVGEEQRDELHDKSSSKGFDSSSLVYHLTDADAEALAFFATSIAVSPKEEIPSFSLIHAPTLDEVLGAIEKDILQEEMRSDETAGASILIGAQSNDTDSEESSVAAMFPYEATAFMLIDPALLLQFSL